MYSVRVFYHLISLSLHPSIPISLYPLYLYLILSLFSEISSKANQKYGDMAPKHASLQLHNANQGLGSTSCFKTSVRLLMLLQVWRKRLQFCDASCKFQNILQSAACGAAFSREHTSTVLRHIALSQLAISLPVQQFAIELVEISRASPGII